MKKIMKTEVEKDESYREDKGYSPDSDEESNFQSPEFDFKIQSTLQCSPIWPLRALEKLKYKKGKTKVYKSNFPEDSIDGIEKEQMNEID